MLIDARSIESGEIVEADLCIIGAGPAGISIALEFINRSTKVVLLESGGLKSTEANQALCQGLTIGRSYHPLDTCRLRFLGGSSNYWGGWCRPLDALDFETREGFPNSGWPFPKEHLEAEYERAQVVCKLGPYNYDPRHWRDHENASGPDPASEAFDDTVFQISPTRFGYEYRPILSKAQNLVVMLNANVLEVVTDQHERTVTEVRAGTIAGNHFSVAARYVILAAGGIENPRLMLASRQVSSSGVGNENDVVGRYFTDHFHVPLGNLSNLDDALPLFFQKHKVNGVTMRGGLTLTENIRRRERLLGFAVTLHNDEDPHDVLSPADNHEGYKSLQFLLRSLSRGELPDPFWKNVAKLWMGLDDAVALSYAKLVKPKHQRLMIGCRAEQVPNRDSRVVLDNSKDRFGTPRVRLDWRISEQDLFSLRRARDLLANELVRRTFGQTLSMEGSEDSLENEINSGAHHIGTTRMHKDPKLGVVNENCQVHGVGNLYVAGSSVFPTAGWAPPTLTIVALALRLADHLKKFLP